MKSLEEKQKIACEIIKKQKEEIYKLKQKVGNQRKQLKEFNRIEKEGKEAILAEETRIKLRAREIKKREKMNSAQIRIQAN